MNKLPILLIASLCIAPTIARSTEEPVVIWERNAVKPAYIASFAILFSPQHRVYVRSLIHTAETVVLESGEATIELQEKIELLKALTTVSILLVRNSEKEQENQFVDQSVARTFAYISEDIIAQKPLDPALIAEAEATIDALIVGFDRDGDAWKQLGGTKIGIIAWNGIRKAAREANSRD